MPDYREQYINDSSKSQRNKRGKIAHEKRPLTQETSFTPKSSSDVDQSSKNMTKTMFSLAPTHSLGANNVSLPTDHPSKNVKRANQGSVLVRAYCNQENQKATSN